MMQNEFQMSIMGELTFFLGIQVKQAKQDTFVHQVKYMKDLMKKFNMDELKSVSTSMSIATSLDPDKNGDVVDQREYMSMIDSLLYLTVTWSDIQFVVCFFHAFRLLHTPHIGQQFSKCSSTSSTLLGLGFDNLFLLRLILLAFPMLILRVVGLTERALLVFAIF
jgi:hypothetical protein